MRASGVNDVEESNASAKRNDRKRSVPCDDDAQPNKKATRERSPNWQIGETMTFLSIRFNESMDRRFNSIREAKDGDDIWKEIASRLNMETNSNRTWTQCQIRVKTLLAACKAKVNEFSIKPLTGNDEAKKPYYWDILERSLQNKIGMRGAHIVGSSPELLSEIDREMGSGEQKNPFNPRKSREPWHPPPKKKNDVEKIHDCMERLVNHL
ncbi:hypothetical protein AeMF1_006713, partial [Aphanomyces euteiches]